MHENGLSSLRRTFSEAESLICPADSVASAAPRELLSAEARKVRLRLLREQARPEDLSLRQLLAEPHGLPPSVTVVLEFTSAPALCRQLEALLHQSVKAHAIWVSDFQSADGGAEARRLVARFRSDTISVISSSGAPGGDGRGSGTHGLGRRARFQMALQASTRHVLVLDAAVRPGVRLLETLSHVADARQASAQ